MSEAKLERIVPELPEVETMRRGIEDLAGSRIAKIERGPCRKKPILISPALAEFRRRTVGTLVSSVGRAGKRVVLELVGGNRVIFEPRMTGLLLLSDSPGDEYVRLKIEFSRPRRSLLYWDRRGLGSVRLMSPAQFDETLGPGRLGPDALEISADVLHQRLGRSRRAIKVALLDQQAVAGIGNLYASEILYAALIRPTRRCDHLSRAEWARLAGAISEILTEAITYEGSTLSDGTYRNALNQQGDYQNHHRVYDRAGDLCRRCGRAAIERIVQAQRATYFCPICQSRRSNSSRDLRRVKPR